MNLSDMNMMMRRINTRFEGELPDDTVAPVADPEAVTEAVADQTAQVDDAVEAQEETAAADSAQQVVDEAEDQKEEAEMLYQFISRNGINDTVLALYNYGSNRVLDACAGYSLPSSASRISRRMVGDVLAGLRNMSNNYNDILMKLRRYR